jgi:hypothetical protein
MFNYVWTKRRKQLCNGTGVRQLCCLSSILFNLHSEYLAKITLESFRYFKLGVKVIRAVEYADGLVLMAKEETALRDIIDTLMGFKDAREWNWMWKEGGNENLKATVPNNEYNR